jgi:hypothetical protein
MPKHKELVDGDYHDESSAPAKKKAKTNRKSNPPISKLMSKQESQTFLDNHFEFIVSNHQAGLKPTNIAAMLCAEVNRPGAVTSKQVSNWIYQRKKSGKIQTRPVSGKNNNLRADSSSQSSWQNDLQRIAKESGQALEENEIEDEEEIGEDSEDEHRLYELTSKFLRFFTHADNDNFFVFIECGVQRDFTLQPVFDQTQLELSITIPKPEDDLFHFVGISHATDVHIEDTEELI